MTKYNFRTFDKLLTPPSPIPLVTLQKGGLLTLNWAALEALENPSAVELLYDPEARALGLRAVDPKAPTAFRIHRQKRSYKMGLARVCTYYGIDTTKSTRYAPVMNEDVLVIELDKPVGEPTRARNKPRE